MNRREAIRWMGLASLAVFLNFNASKMNTTLHEVVESQGILYLGTMDGDIHISQDGGRNWKLHSRFGPQMMIKGISKDLGGQVIAHMEYQGLPILLGLSNNGRHWMTL